jgi:hypothetical protein
MTTEQEDLIRLKAWDSYVAAKKKYHACRAQLEQWGKALEALGSKLRNQPVAVIGHDIKAFLPDSETLLKGIQDFHNAGTEFKRAWTAARNFDFPVGKDDLNELGGV